MPKICSHTGCNTPVFSKGFCQTHWRWWKASQPTLAQTDNKVAKPLKAISDKQAKRLAKYRVVRDEFLKDNNMCQFPGCQSTDITLHHAGGKVGDMLWNKKYFRALCWHHHEYCERHPIVAKELNLSVDRLDK